MNAQKKITENMYVVNDANDINAFENLTVLKNDSSEKKAARMELEEMTVTLSKVVSNYASAHRFSRANSQLSSIPDTISTLSDHELLETAAWVLDKTAEYESQLWKYDVNRKTILTFLNKMSVFQFLVSLP